MGEGSKTFTIHSYLIANQSRVLEVLINGSLKEANERQVVWKDVEVDTFLHFCQFIYTGDYIAIRPPDENEGSEPVNLEDIQESIDRDLTLKDQTDGESDIKSAWSGLNPHYDWSNSKWCDLWDKFKDLRPQVKQGLNLRKNSNELTSSAALHPHARIYIFADCYGIQDLQDRALNKLHDALSIYELGPLIFTDKLAALVRYVYANTVADDISQNKLREMVVIFLGRHVRLLWKDLLFRDLIDEDGEFCRDLMKLVMEWTDSASLVSL